MVTSSENRHNARRTLTSPVFMFCLIALLLNDMFLKNAFPGFVTGKISDFAGLFVFPYFLSYFFPRYRKLIHISTVVLFVSWKMPISDPLIAFWNQYMFFTIGRIVDFSDYIALPMVYASYRYAPINRGIGGSGFRRFLILLSGFAIVATAGTYGRITEYRFSTSKGEVYSAIQSLYTQFPSYKVPEEYKEYAQGYRAISRPGDPWAEKMSSDSVSFHFYLSDKRWIVWCGYSKTTENWDKPGCELVMITVTNTEGHIYQSKEISCSESREFEEVFEAVIVNKLRQILQEKQKQ